jgi:hypothetical protein
MSNLSYFLKHHQNFKGKYEYCHIDNDKIVITRTPEIENLVTDYSKSINDSIKH